MWAFGLLGVLFVTFDALLVVSWGELWRSWCLCKDHATFEDCCAGVPEESLHYTRRGALAMGIEL